MTGPAGSGRPGPAEPRAAEAARLRLDLDDLRFENERLKASILQRQEEIAVLSGRLAALQARLSRLDRLAAWAGGLRRLTPLRLLFRARR